MLVCCVGIVSLHIIFCWCWCHVVLRCRVFALSCSEVVLVSLLCCVELSCPALPRLGDGTESCYVQLGVNQSVNKPIECVLFSVLSSLYL